MEHLMLHEELIKFKNEIPVVPWLGGDHDTTEEREPGPFTKYPLARGWTVDEVLKPYELLRSDPERALPMLQSWLLFGMLEGATMYRSETRLPEPLRKEGYQGFVESSPEGDIVCFQPLNGLRTAWNFFIETTKHNERERQKSLRDTVSNASIMIADLTTLRDDGTLEEPLIDSIIRCAILLLDMIVVTAPTSLSFAQGLVSIRWSIPSTIWAQIGARFRKNGWCPSTLQRLSQKFGSYSLLEYASYFQATDQSVSKHSLCDKDRCIASNVDVEHCQASHVLPECQCRFIRPSLDDIRRIINSGELPVLTYGPKIDRREVDGVLHYHIGAEFGINVTEYDPGWKMLAVSHVWSDGLMGTTETGLPECQVGRIYDMMHTLGMDCFWIDALAIPGERGLRKTAISRMSQAYSLATRTVILDKGLQQLDGRGEISRGELLLRISTSTWSHRLWTLQEVALAHNPYIMFRNGFLPLDQFHNEWLENVETRPSPVNIAFTKEITQIRGMRYRSLMTIGRLSHILGDRDSSRRDDETLAIASLLKLNVSSLLNVQSEERMKVFWLQLAQIPRDIIGTSHPRMSLEGFRALPRTMLRVRSTQPLSIRNTDLARITDRGLRATYRVYDFEELVPMAPGYRGFIYDIERDWILKLRRFFNQIHDDEGFDAFVMVDELTPSNPVSFGAALLRTGEMEGEIPIYSFLGTIEANIEGGGGVVEEGLYTVEQMSELDVVASYQEEIIIS